MAGRARQSVVCYACRRDPRRHPRQQHGHGVECGAGWDGRGGVALLHGAPGSGLVRLTPGTVVTSEAFLVTAPDLKDVARVRSCARALAALFVRERPFLVGAADPPV